MKCAGLVCLCSLVAPLAADAGTPAKDVRFGVMTHFAHGWDPELIAAVARSGIGTVRDEVYWRDVEPEKGVFAFSAHYDRTMSRLGGEEIEPLVVLSFENDAYDGGNTPYSDEAMAGFARYGGEVLRHYGGQVKAVEVWNEYNGSFVRGLPEGDRAATYLRMLRAAYQEVKRLRPDVLVVGGATAGVPLPYWEKLLAGGALECMDVLSVHPYRYDAEPEGLETDVAELHALVARYNQGKTRPIWVTEIGWNTQAAKAEGDLVIDDLVQAQFLVRAYALLFSAGVERVYWYLFRDYNDALMGLVRGDPLATPKPAFAAMATMTEQLRGAAFAGRDPASPGIHALRFRRASGEMVRVMWSLTPRVIEVSGVTSVTDMLGRALGSSGALELGASPLYVVGEIQGLPEATEMSIADSRMGFAGTQGRNGWSFGYVRAGGGFTPLPVYDADDWRAAWRGDPPFLVVTAKEQHPSVLEGAPVGAVRRWESDRQGEVRVEASFQGGKRGGDGVGVAVVVDGQLRLRRVLGGAPDAPVSQKFEFVETIQPGTTLDFVVDPGPAANIDHDGVAVAVKLFLRHE
jgi:hypothetical protein